MPPTPRFDPEELLRHDTFVRELARRLVFDGQAADDVVQDTWAAALAAPSRPIDSMRGWLATIARRVAGRRARTDRRRTKREQAVADDAPAPSVAELVAREEARSTVVQAVLALPESYRDVVVLRWFEGLPPRDVARRLGIPVETVRTRHRRALEQLRETLDAQHEGARRAWMAALLPLTAVPAPPAPPPLTPTAGATLLGGTLLMSTKMMLTAAAAATVALACWALYSGAPIPLAPEGARGTERAAVATGSPPNDPGAALAVLPAQREAATPMARTQTAAPAPTTGSVAIQVLWHDRTPAPEVQVLLFGPDTRRFVTTDGEGVARFADLAPGDYLGNVERGSARDLRDVQQPRVSVIAGQEATAEIVVAEGLQVSGIVVDGHENPIAGAEILINSSTPIVVARTGADGRFRARDVGCYSSIGARAPGLAPSFLQTMTGSRGASVELRFVLDQPAGTIEGLVLGPDHQPVAGVIVRLRDHRGDVRLPDGMVGIPPRYGRILTDENGRFTFDPVAPCELEVLVVSDDFSLWTRRVTLEPGGRLQVTANLAAGVRVHGVVRDTAGRPLHDVRVVASDAADYVSTHHTARDGSYDIAGAPAGTLTLTLGDKGTVTVTHSVVAVPGQVVQWDPVLPRTVSLHGRVVDHEGRPVHRATVVASHHSDGSGYWSSGSRTDETGAFRLTNCEAGVPVHLTVSLEDANIQVARLSGVVPDEHELRITLPPPTEARVHGVVVDEQGEPLPNVEVYVLGHHDRVGMDTNRPDGSFAFGPFPAGEYRLLMRHQERGWLRTPFRAIGDGETWDTGPLRMPRAGSLRATLVGDGSLADRFVEVMHDNGEYAGGSKSSDGVAVVGPLAPGSYLLKIDGDDTICQLVPFTMQEGVDTVLDVPMRKGTSVALTFAPTADQPAPLEVEVTITDTTTGLRRLRRTVRGDDLTLRTMLPPGRFRIEASGTNKMQKTLACSVEIDVATAPLQQTLELRLRD